MSTNISTGFTAIKNKLITLFPESSGYYQLNNPYDVAKNTVTMHEKGWGIAIGPASNTERELACHLSLQRTMSVILTRRRYANELDTANKEAAELAILEDQFTLIKTMEYEINLNNSISGLTRFTYVSDGGIETTLENNDAFIKLITVFEMEYFENLSP